MIYKKDVGIVEERLRSLVEFEKQFGKGSIYSNKFKPTKTIDQYRKDYSHLQNGESLTQDIQIIAGFLLAYAL